MLGKLIKYEFKSTSRVMWILYGALIVVGALLGVVFRIDDGGSIGVYGTLFLDNDSAFRVLSVSLVSIYILMLQAIFIMTVIMIISRFYRNLLGGEGYLMHTLPVGTHNLVLSKLIISIVWGLIAAAAGLISAFLLSLTSGAFKLFLEEFDSWAEFWELVSRVFTTNTVLAIVLIIVAAISTVLCFYFAMAIGNLANKHKFLFAVLAYLGIQIIVSIVATIIGLSGSGYIRILFGIGYSSSLREYLIRYIVQHLVLALVFFSGTTLILNKKLNLL